MAKFKNMAKVDTELVKIILQRAELDARTVAQIMEDIDIEVKAKAEISEKEPPVKKQYVMVVSDPKGRFTDADYVGWVLQIPEDDRPDSALEKVFKGAGSFNLTPKGRRLPLKTFSEACEFGSAKLYKEQKVWIKTKEPVLIVRTDNKIPRSGNSREEE